MIHSRAYTDDTSTLAWSRRFPTWIGREAGLGPNRYQVPWHAQHLVAVRDGGGQARLLSNICPHKQALIHGGPGEAEGVLGTRLVCPVHRWNWDLDGTDGVGRGFARGDCPDLEESPLHAWRGHLWTGDAAWQHQLGSMEGIDALLDISNMVPASRYEAGVELPRQHMLGFGFDWKIFMEIYLDLYHVSSAHRGLSSLTDPRGFGYHTGQGWSCQTALFNRDAVIPPSYRDVASVYKGTGLWDTARFGAVWLGIYPNTMLEYYPGVVVISTVWPARAGRCVNHLQFLYDPEIVRACHGFPMAFERYFMHTSDEDEAIGLRMQQGRQSMDSWLEPRHHQPEESGIAHFHSWLAENQLAGDTTR